MEKLTFRISIDASREKIWDVLWNDVTYPVWTSVFMEGSGADTGGQNWKKGSKVLFLSPEKDGMVSTVAENIPNEFMSFNHLGIVKGGVEDLDSEEARKWAGALENYTLRTVDGKTELTVETDIAEEYKDYFVDVWPKALDKVKELAEKVEIPT